MADPNFVRLGVDASAFMRGLDDLQRTQFPFAFAKTLSDSARSGMLAAKERTRRAFELHTDFIPNNIVMTTARVGDVKYGVAFASVRTTEKIAFMSWHEYGGVKRPQGSALAIPTFTAQRRVGDLRSRTGKIRSKYLPKQVLKKWNQGQRGGSGGSGLSGYITAGMIFARVRNRFRSGGGSKEGLPLFALEGNAKIKRTWHFERVIRVRVERVILGHFKKNMDHALATMRK